MRFLPPAPSELDEKQKALYTSIREITDVAFHRSVQRDGSLPEIRRSCLGDEQDYVRPYQAAEITSSEVIGSHMQARYQIFGHEQLLADSGAPLQKIATLTASQRPTDLTAEESVAFDVAYALNPCGLVAESTYRAGEALFGREGLAEIIYLVGTFHLIAIMLNGYDVSVPGHEDGLV